MSEKFGIEVRNQLFKVKMTQSELAKRIGISDAYLSDIIRGKKDGTKAQEHIRRIKKVLGI